MSNAQRFKILQLILKGRVRSPSPIQISLNRRIGGEITHMNFPEDRVLSLLVSINLCIGEAFRIRSAQIYDRSFTYSITARAWLTRCLHSKGSHGFGIRIEHCLRYTIVSNLILIIVSPEIRHIQFRRINVS
ncbi:hypothetical protein D3C73_959040 [compost metagenome]